MQQVMAAAKAGGVWPFAHFNRLHVAPPLITSDDDLLAGLAAIDVALDVADSFSTES
jgi:taurine--2-oxoglutarate transaminase